MDRSAFNAGYLTKLAKLEGSIIDPKFLKSYLATFNLKDQLGFDTGINAKYLANKRLNAGTQVPVNAPRVKPKLPGRSSSGVSKKVVTAEAKPRKLEKLAAAINGRRRWDGAAYTPAYSNVFGNVVHLPYTPFVTNGNMRAMLGTRYPYSYAAPRSGNRISFYDPTSVMNDLTQDAMDWMQFRNAHPNMIFGGGQGYTTALDWMKEHRYINDNGTFNRSMALDNGLYNLPAINDFGQGYTLQRGNGEYAMSPASADFSSFVNSFDADRSYNAINEGFRNWGKEHQNYSPEDANTFAEGIKARYFPDDTAPLDDTDPLDASWTLSKSLPVSQDRAYGSRADADARFNWFNNRELNGVGRDGRRSGPVARGSLDSWNAAFDNSEMKFTRDANGRVSVAKEPNAQGARTMSEMYGGDRDAMKSDWYASRGIKWVPKDVHFAAKGNITHPNAGTGASAPLRTERYAGSGTPQDYSYTSKTASPGLFKTPASAGRTFMDSHDSRVGERVPETVRPTTLPSGAKVGRPEQYGSDEAEILVGKTAY